MFCRIGWAEGKQPTKIRVKQDKKVETAQVHVSFISKQVFASPIALLHLFDSIFVSIRLMF